MSWKILILVLIFVLNLSTSFGQELNCSYGDGASWGYTCDLKIINPNGFNNFTLINGTHLEGMRNEDVWWINRVFGSNSSNIPSIICETFNNAVRIDLSSVGIQSVAENSFRNCKNLQHLYLYSNQIAIWPVNIFQKQQKLVELSIHSNNISDLPENIFDPLQNLDDLVLAINPIKNLRNEWFEKLGNMRELRLQDMQIEELPKDVFSSMKKLELINLGINKIRVIHADSFGILPNLTTVYISNNQIDAIDEKFIDNTGVQFLDMTYNKCANVYIYDLSASRESMRNKLQVCFENYQLLMPGQKFIFYVLLKQNLHWN